MQTIVLQNFEYSNPVPKTSCCECAAVFEKKRKTKDYVPAGQINSTIQKDTIHGKVNVLYTLHILKLNVQKGYPSPKQV